MKSAFLKKNNKLLLLLFCALLISCNNKKTANNTVEQQVVKQAVEEQLELKSIPVIFENEGEIHIERTFWKNYKNEKWLYFDIELKDIQQKFVLKETIIARRIPFRVEYSRKGKYVNLNIIHLFNTVHQDSIIFVNRKNSFAFYKAYLVSYPKNFDKEIEESFTENKNDTIIVNHILE